MNKKILIIGLIALVLTLSACTSSLVSQSRVNRMMTDDFFVGTDGLVVDFLEQAPPADIYELTDFDVQTYIHNKGAFSLTQNYSAKLNLIYDNGKVSKVTDDVSNYFGTTYINVSTQTVELFGKSYLFSSGEKNYFPIDRFRAREIPPNFESTTTNFGLSVCYPYQTIFADEICIDSDPQNFDPRKDACATEDKSYSNGQGAPIAITAIDVLMVPRGVFVQPQFIIYIENKGSGFVYRYQENLTSTYNRDGFLVQPGELSTTKSCGKNSKKYPNQMKIIATLGQENLTCTLPELRNGKTKVQCQLSDLKISGNVANYMTNLQIKLEYFYVETFNKKVSVKQADGLEIDTMDPLDPEYCLSWQTFDSGKCVDNCDYFAIHSQDLLEEKGLKLHNDLNWSDIGCIYTNPSSCRAADELCTVNSSNLCQRGRYCGWPACVLDNAAPSIEEVVSVGASSKSVAWKCIDFDDINDIENTCGCGLTGYYHFFYEEDENTNCASLDPTTMDEISGKLVYDGAVKFEKAVPKSATKMCIAVRDKLGEFSGVRAADI